MTRNDMVSEDSRAEGGRIVEPDRRQQPPPAESDPGSQVLNADTVRSGPPGRPVLMVLVASLSAIVILFALYYAFWTASM